MFKYILQLTTLAATLLIPCLTSCDDDIRWENEEENPTITESKLKGMYVLCEGGKGNNNSSISYYDFKEGGFSSFQDPELTSADKTNYDYFKQKNNRKLGDTANDLQQYGSKLWCVVDISSQIEVMDLNSGQSLKQIPLFNGVNAREPRYITFWKDKAYVCNFDGTVARIDTTSLAVEAFVNVGRNPDGICAANNKLYVANSGGLDYGNPDNTVSVVDIATFTETQKIEVRKNLSTILADAKGNVYVVSREEFNYDIYDYDCRLHRIDSQSDTVMTNYEERILDFIISGETAYMYTSPFGSTAPAVITLNTHTGEIDHTNLLANVNDTLNCVYGLAIEPLSQDLYVINADTYSTYGSIYCIDRDRNFRFKLNAK